MVLPGRTELNPINTFVNRSIDCETPPSPAPVLGLTNALEAEWKVILVAKFTLFEEAHVVGGYGGLEIQNATKFAKQQFLKTQ